MLVCNVLVQVPVLCLDASNKLHILSPIRITLKPSFVVAKVLAVIDVQQGQDVNCLIVIGCIEN